MRQYVDYYRITSDNLFFNFAAALFAGATKKILSKVFKPLVLPLQVCFCRTKVAIDEDRFTCIVSCGVRTLTNNLYRYRN
jgi:hypothetical protein